MILTRDNAVEIYQISHMAREFIEEADYGLTFDFDLAMTRILAAVDDPQGDFVYIKEGDTVAAAASVWAVSDWQVERMGYLEKFYVRPAYRSKQYGRKLAALMSQWFDDHGCAYSFATATANVGHNRLFANLLAKYGYKSCGDTVYRSNQGGNHG